MKTPNLPSPQNWIIKNKATGNYDVHPAVYNAFQQLFTALQQNLSNEGYKVPQQSAANIATLNTEKSTSALLYDSDNHQLKVNINGTFKTITTS